LQFSRNYTLYICTEDYTMTQKTYETIRQKDNHVNRVVTATKGI